MSQRTGLFSLSLLSVGLLTVGPASAQDMASPRPTYEQTLRALTACGVPPGNIRIAYVDDFQSDVVTISDLGGTGEARMRCVKKAVHVSYVVLIGAEDQRRDYYALDRAVAVPASRRPRLRARLGDIARGCELPARSLVLDAAGRIRFRPPADARYEAVDCALFRMRKAGLSDHLPMAFIGNETYETGNPQ